MFLMLHAATPFAGFDVMRFLPFILIFVVFYFLMFKPQNDKLKKQKQMQDSLVAGDKILTNSGLFGQINKIVDDKEMLLEIADGVKVRCLKQIVVDKKG